ncbi:VOC family protein [Actinomycetospora endophytica]|uniref:VOC family protein n=1 Tax=Actinomycetospora endophytica TaxID=2291215 RepID=A0ABS8PD77_9PSEU|nr:VOC family protein [Actinomycetospora endophytica]MCD2195356.1 VOC family protein [Actinomycetospora endophytica]
MAAPSLTNIHHYSPTVSDVEASAAWYERILGLARVPAPFPHWGDEEGGHAVVLAHPAGFLVGLHHHEAHIDGSFDERKTGLDHIAFGVASRADLDAWTAWLDESGVPHSGVQDLNEPMPLSTVVFRDPDNIQLELFYADL